MNTIHIFMGCAVAIALAACSTVETREPICSPPPIPSELLVPCEEAILPTGPTFAEVYENAVQNATGPWARCIRKDDKLVALVLYRDKVCEKIKADNETPSKRPWYQFGAF